MQRLQTRRKRLAILKKEEACLLVLLMKSSSSHLRIEHSRVKLALTQQSRAPDRHPEPWRKRKDLRWENLLGSGSMRRRRASAEPEIQGVSALNKTSMDVCVCVWLSHVVFPSLQGHPNKSNEKHVRH